MSGAHPGRRARFAGVAALVALLAALGSACSEQAEPTPDCAANLAEGEAKVRTNHEWSELQVPGLGDYRAVYWQVRAAGDPCSRPPGPTDWHYQGVVHLQMDDARDLARRFDWQPVSPSPSPDEYKFDTPAQMWPALTQSLPGSVRWLHSDEYAETQSFGGRWGDLYLDPDRAVAFFVLYDH